MACLLSKMGFSLNVAFNGSPVWILNHGNVDSLGEAYITLLAPLSRVMHRPQVERYGEDFQLCHDIYA